MSSFLIFSKNFTEKVCPMCHRESTAGSSQAVGKYLTQCVQSFSVQCNYNWQHNPNRVPSTTSNSKRALRIVIDLGTIHSSKKSIDNCTKNRLYLLNIAARFKIKKKIGKLSANSLASIDLIEMYSHSHIKHPDKKIRIATAISI